MKLLIFATFLFPYLALAAPGFGVVTLAKGDVEAINAAGEKRKLKVGDKVFESETIVTEKMSAARLAMMDTNVIEIYPSSSMKIEKYIYNPKEDKKNVSLEITQGRIKSTVKQKYDNEKNKYNVKTPVIVAGVRGTTFSAEHEPKTDQSRVVTFEGNVLVGKRGPDDMVKEFFAVKANQSVSLDTKADSKPEVKEMPRVEQEKIKSEDKKEGFEKPANVPVEKAIEAREVKVNTPAPAAAAPPQKPDRAATIGTDKPATATIIQETIGNRIENAKAKEAIIKTPVAPVAPVAPINPIVTPITTPGGSGYNNGSGGRSHDNGSGGSEGHDNGSGESK